jgi:Bacterial TSP3 repeat
MRLFLIVFFSLFCAIPQLSAQGNGIEQTSDLVTVGPDKFLRWYGHADRTYFIQVSDPNDHLNRWTWAPIIESGNNADISYEVDGTADKGFFRLKYTDQPTTDPDNDDFDGDSISNIDEVSYYNSDPLDSDTDNDGMPDGYEVTYYFDLNFDDGGYDYDGDGLTNLGEYTAATEPYYSDTDGDGMNDGFEVTYLLNPLVSGDAGSDADLDGLSNLWEYKLRLNPRLTDSNSNGLGDALEDRELDGLANLAELTTHNTDPSQPDTDMDTLPDGWELANGFDPTVHNGTDGDATNDATADPDGDGLNNSQEADNESKAKNADSDGDGVDDGTEVGQGSNPNDPNDSQPPPSGTAPVNVTFGDDSGSHSEKYRVKLTPLEGDPGGPRFRTNRSYGASQTDTFQLPKGAKYKVELIHIGTKPGFREQYGFSNYDWTLDIDTSADCLVVNDPDTILTTVEDWPNSTFQAEGKNATLYVPLFEWVTPKSSPVSAPDDAGDGQNEFTYSAAAQGVLTMDMKVLVKPTGTAGITGHDGVKFSDRCFYKLPTISGSTLAWDGANAGGMSAASGEHLTARATYTTLPAANADFGLKQAEFECDGHTDTLPKGDFEVFFPKDEKNHPGVGAGTTPNWFFYWQQFIPLGRIATLNFGGNGYGSTNPVTRVTEVGQLASERNDETGHRGLHTFYETLAHESHHIVLWEGWWGQGGLPTQAQDTDGDTYPDTFEGNQAGYGFSIGQNDDYANGVPSTAQNPRWPNESAGYNYEEELCRQVEQNLNESQFDNQDWSHDPTNTNQGKNHK